MSTRRVLIGAAACLLVVGAGDARAQATCQGEGTVRSIESNVPTTIEFWNHADNDEDYYRIYWLNFSGNRQLYAEIFTGRGHHQPTFLTHPWLVTAPVPGGGEICVGIYMPDVSKRTINLQ